MDPKHHDDTSTWEHPLSATNERHRMHYLLMYRATNTGCKAYDSYMRRVVDTARDCNCQVCQFRRWEDPTPEDVEERKREEAEKMKRALIRAHEGETDVESKMDSQGSDDDSSIKVAPVFKLSGKVNNEQKVSASLPTPLFNGPSASNGNDEIPEQMVHAMEPAQNSFEAPYGARPSKSYIDGAYASPALHSSTAEASSWHNDSMSRMPRRTREPVPDQESKTEFPDLLYGYRGKAFAERQKALKMAATNTEFPGQ